MKRKRPSVEYVVNGNEPINSSLEIETLARDIVESENLGQLKDCLYRTAAVVKKRLKGPSTAPLPADDYNYRSLHGSAPGATQAGRRELISPEDFFVYAPGVGPVGTVPIYQQIAIDDNYRRSTLFSALQRTLIWVLNYSLVTQVNKHISTGQTGRQFESLMLILGLLTFASSAIESINGRFVLIAFLSAINFLIFINTHVLAKNKDTKN